jgi:hypothetical protein
MSISATGAEQSMMEMTMNSFRALLTGLVLSAAPALTVSDASASTASDCGSERLGEL